MSRLNRRDGTTRSAHVLGCGGIIAGVAIVGTVFAGCGSSKSSGPAADGSHESGGTPGLGGIGSGGTVAEGGGTVAGSGGIAAGGIGSGGVGSGGAAGNGSAGAGAGGQTMGGSGGKATGGTGPGGTGGRGGAGGSGVGGTGAGGIGAGGIGVVDAGVCPSGQMWCPGCTPGTGSCGAACLGLVCPVLDAGTVDALLSQDAPVECSQIRTQAACDQRSDCHSVSFASEACGCSTPGCCTTFDHCDNGGAVACNGRVTCPQATPFCEAPYVVQYLGDCFGGCVLASKCAATASCPLAVPSNGASCGAAALSCVYQDCAGAGHTEATCKAGTWSVQTASCDAMKCSGGGVYTGFVLCGADQLCARTTGGGGAYIITPSCIDNTCAPSPVTAQCLVLPSICGVELDTPKPQVNCTEPSLCGHPGACP